jgi:hypothetical protein
MTDDVEKVEADDDFFDDDLEDAQTAAVTAFETGDELSVADVADDDDIPERPAEHTGAEDDPEVDQELGVREPEGDTS